MTRTDVSQSSHRVNALRRIHGDRRHVGSAASCRRRSRSLTRPVSLTSSRWWRARGMGLFASHPLRPIRMMTCLSQSPKSPRFDNSALLIRLADISVPMRLEVAFSITARSLTFHVASEVPGGGFPSPHPISIHPASPEGARRWSTLALPDAVVARPCLRGECVTASKRLPSSIGPSRASLEVHPRRSPGLEKGRGSRTRFAPSSPRDRVERLSRILRS